MKNKSLQRTAFLLAGAFLWNLPLGACASLSIEQAVDLALAQNPSVKITQKGEDTAQAALRQAKGAKGFTVTAGSNVAASKTSGESRTTSNSNSITAKLPLYTGGKNEAAVDRTQIGVKIAKLNTDREREDIRLSVIQAYYDVLEAQKTVQVDQESVDNYQAHLTNVQQLYSAGSEPRIDVLRSAVELSNARQTLIKAQNAYEIKVSTLKNTLNMDRNEPLTLTEDFSYQPFHQEMNSCLDYALQNRKDLLAAQYTLDQKNLAVKEAKAGLLPSVSLSVGTSWNNQFSPSNSNDTGYTAGVSASWDIFDSGVTQAAIDSAKTDVEIAQLTLQKDKNDVDLAVRQAYYNMKEAEKRFTSTQDAVHQAKEDYYIAREKYRAGAGTMLDIIDAQLALSTAQLNFISAQYDYARYKAAVENAMGLSAPAKATAVSAHLPAAGKSTPTTSIQQPTVSAESVAREAAANEVKE